MLSTVPLPPKLRSLQGLGWLLVSRTGLLQQAHFSFSLKAEVSAKGKVYYGQLPRASNLLLPAYAGRERSPSDPWRGQGCKVPALPLALPPEPTSGGEKSWVLTGNQVSLIGFTALEERFASTRAHRPAAVVAGAVSFGGNTFLKHREVNVGFLFCYSTKVQTPEISIIKQEAAFLIKLINTDQLLEPRLSGYPVSVRILHPYKNTHSFKPIGSWCFKSLFKKETKQGHCGTSTSTQFCRGKRKP